ncbi:MAG: UvrD-helicase domain-containing protein, partial [Marinospirillum sp.]|uniref:UvrD-helicase domain-containing protein n=1 Tax=Marinospirillum sp. TaxID=2183934 RepID=UPI0019DBAF2D
MKVFQPTQEQHQVISHDFKLNPVLKVFAFAGAGKTTVLKALAEASPGMRILYLAFGRDIRDEAAAKFPSQVECKTSHQMAWGYGRLYQHRLTQNLQMRDVAGLISSDDWMVVKGAMQTLTNYLASADHGMDAKHISREMREASKDHRSKVTPAKLNRMLEGAKHLWNTMIDKDSNFPVVHDVYLKLYQLSKPDLSRYDMILFDEAQDANPVTTDIVMRQKQVYRVLVGDTHQQIYRFRGAENAMNDPSLKDAASLYLTGSFRFGQRIAASANAILQVVKGEQHKVQGLSPKEDGIIGAREFEELMESGKHKGEILALSRTGAGVLEKALDAMASGKKIYWIGTPQGYGVNDLQNLFYFKEGELQKVRNKKLIHDFTDFEEYREVAEASGDYEMNKLIRLLDKYGQKVPRYLSRIKECSTDDRGQADLVVSSAHRSKGLEARFVSLNDDWPDISDPEVIANISREVMIDE